LENLLCRSSVIHKRIHTHRSKNPNECLAYQSGGSGHPDRCDLYFQTVSLKQSALWIVSALMGITLYFSSFGFTQAWRVFIANGRGAGLRAQMVMLAIGVLLFFHFFRRVRYSITR